jgi:hypothetical protein
VVKVVVALLGLHAMLKFATFFVVPYKIRRAALDRAYGNRASATQASDVVLLAVAVLVFVMVLWRGLEPTSFLAGLWIGATAVQVYFHRFHRVLAPEQSPPPIVSPIKMMSYAIQAAPMRGASEMLLLSVMIVWCIALMARH